MRMNSFKIWIWMLLLLAPMREARGETRFSIPVDGKVVFCQVEGSQWVPAIKIRGGTFRTVSAELRLLATRMKASRGRTLTSLTKRSQDLRSIRRRATPLCRQGPSDGSITPTPEPTRTPAPTATPAGCFVRGGLTAPGCFGIPSPMVGSIDRGQIYYRQNCSGCHTSRFASPYNKVLAAFSNIPQMRPFTPQPQDLADIVAYLNRFNF